MAQNPNGRLARELTKEEQLDKALKSAIAELPENQPKGLLGETGIDIRKVDDFAPDLNAGLSQENDMPVIWMAIVLGYLIFFIPGFVILWLSKRVPIRTKIVASIIMAVGAISFLAVLFARG
jgi:hypothetical protein